MGDETKSFEFLSPEVDTNVRKLEGFMDVCKKIMETANIDSDSITEG
jgi:hypothetical protein